MSIYYILAIFILGALPVLFAIKTFGRNYGSSITLMSPLVVFLVAYLIFGLLRPILYFKNNFSYDFTTIVVDQYNLSLVVIAISNWFLSLGYFVGSGKFVPVKKIMNSTETNSILILVAIIFILIAYAHATSNNLISADISQNRFNYLNSLQGFGFISIFYIYPGFLLLWSYWAERKIGVNYSIFVLMVLYLIINVSVSNRSIVTIVIYGFFLTSQIKRSREKNFGFFKIFLFLSGILLLGILLGLSRGLNEVVVDFNFTILLLTFLSATFDMQEMFSHVLSSFSLNNLYYGTTWYQDILYTYLPRALFIFKPEFFGSTLLEYEVLGRESSAIGLATFPLGIYSEGYLNFWYLGIAFSIFVTGYILGFLFTRILKYGKSGPNIYNFWPLFVYLSTSANTLGYLRSFGQYISGIIFSLVFYYLILMGLVFLKKLLKNSKLKIK
jgi:hypothetical protein